MRSITLLLVVLSFTVTSRIDEWTLPFSIFLILVIGIPHGATDHQLFYSLIKGSKILSPAHKKRFYPYYVGAMSVYAITWYFFPVFSFILFILISAYHFGQMNAINVEWDSEGLKTGFAIVSGFFILTIPIISHTETAMPVMERMLQIEIPISLPNHILNTAALILGFIYWLFLIIILKSTKAAGTVFLHESFNWFLLFALFYFTPLWMGFSVYFSLWHALPSMRDQIRFFKQHRAGYKTRHYVFDVMPYTLVSLMALFLASLFLPVKTEADQLALLFAGISIVTLPHVVLMDFLYRHELHHAEISSH